MLSSVCTSKEPLFGSTIGQVEMTEPWQVRPEAASIANMVILIVYVKPQGSMEWVCPGGGAHCGGAGHVASAEHGLKVPASLGIMVTFK